MPETSTTGPVIVAIDQGTSSTKVIVVDDRGSVIAQASAPLDQAHPRPGWVEQDPTEILDSVFAATRTAIAGLESRVAAIGISSQRESAVAWDRGTGEPVGPMLGWQDRRTAGSAQSLAALGHGDSVRERSGLPLDPMFSALKFAWLLDSVDADRKLSSAGRIALGTVDSWLLFKLTGEHRIEVGNASRTQLLGIETAQWDDELLSLFGIPRAALPDVVASSEPSSAVSGIDGLPAEARIHAVLGDSHAALYGHGARTPGAVKVTYGTGSSVMGLATSPVSDPGLVRTIAWSRGTPLHAFEGNILSTGGTLVWLAEILGVTPSRVAELAETVDDSQGVDLVPAFAGLGAPWWDDEAKAIISGFDLGTTSAHLARAAVESIVLQVEDVLKAGDAATDTRVDTILADGGSSANDWLMQLQADFSQRTVVRSAVAELSALGAAHFAGIGAGTWTDGDVLAMRSSSPATRPVMTADASRLRNDRWRSALAKSKSAKNSAVFSHS